MFNPKQIQQAMKKMGIKSEEVDAEEVVIRCRDKNIVVSEPAVTKIMMGAQETFQIVGKISEEIRDKFSPEDVKLVAAQAGRSEEEAIKALDETGDIAEAIMKLKSK